MASRSRFWLRPPTLGWIASISSLAICLLGGGRASSAWNQGNLSRQAVQRAHDSRTDAERLTFQQTASPSLQVNIVIRLRWTESCCSRMYSIPTDDSLSTRRTRAAFNY